MATDFLAFTEGENYLATHGQGLPATCYFLLSTNAVSSFSIANTLAGGVAEITGTGYARQSQSAPVPSGGQVSFAMSQWTTGAATDWPAAVKSIILATTPDNTGKAICVWNLQHGGAARNLSLAGVTEQVTPTITFSS